MFEFERQHAWRADSVLERVPGLTEFLAWIDERGLKKAAVTNAPRENARVMLEALELGCDFPSLVTLPYPLYDHVDQSRTVTIGYFAAAMHAS